MQETIETATILIINDDSEITESMQAFLRNAGLRQVHATSRPSEAMDLYATVAPDLIVLDLHMVDHDGLEIMRRIRAHGDLADYLPILVVSADITDETRHAALSTGARDFLTKPVSENELVLRVRTLLEIRLLYLKLQRHNERLQRMVDERSRALQVDLAKSLASEKAGLRSEERYRWLFDGNLAGVFRSRADGQFLDINDAAAHMFGCASASEAQDHRLADFFADPLSYASLLSTLRAEDGVVNRELLMRRCGSRLRPGWPGALPGTLSRRRSWTSRSEKRSKSTSDGLRSSSSTARWRRT